MICIYLLAKDALYFKKYLLPICHTSKNWLASLAHLLIASFVFFDVYFCIIVSEILFVFGNILLFCLLQSNHVYFLAFYYFENTYYYQLKWEFYFS